MYVKVSRKTNRKITAANIKPGKVKVGFPAGEAAGDIINRAVWNEFGTRRGIPERPFMRITLKKGRNGYKSAMQSSARDILSGKTTVYRVLGKLGAKVQGDIQKTIQALKTPPNAPATIKKKGSSNPLIDTGAMRQAVTYKIED